MCERCKSEGLSNQVSLTCYRLRLRGRDYLVLAPFEALACTLVRNKLISSGAEPPSYSSFSVVRKRDTRRTVVGIVGERESPAIVQIVHKEHLKESIDYSYSYLPDTHAWRGSSGIDHDGFGECWCGTPLDRYGECCNCD